MSTRTLALLLAAAASLSAQPRLSGGKLETTSLSGASLAGKVKTLAPAQGVAWMGWAVPMIPGDRHMCEYNTRLEKPTTGPVRLEQAPVFNLMVRLENGSVSKLRTFSVDCQVDAEGTTLHWITDVPVEASIDYLASLTKQPGRMADGALHSISLHAHSRADDVLEEAVRPSSPEEVRKKATFWLGQHRGKRGYQTLTRLLREDGSESVQKAAIFGLAHTSEPAGIEALIATARTDTREQIRRDALFWLAQKAGKRAVPALTHAVDNDPNRGVKEHAIFAISQLKDGQGVPLLIEQAKNNRDPHIRKKAMFWPGQSKDPRALSFFEEVLTGKTSARL